MVPTEIPEKDCSLLFLGVRPMYAQIYAFSRSIVRYWPDEGLGVANPSGNSAGLNCKQRLVTTGASKVKFLYSIPFGFCLDGNPHEPLDIRYALKIWNEHLTLTAAVVPRVVAEKWCFYW